MPTPEFKTTMRVDLNKALDRIAFLETCCRHILTQIDLNRPEVARDIASAALTLRGGQADCWREHVGGSRSVETLTNGETKGPVSK